MKRIGSAGHIYYISFSSGDLVGFERTCQKCRNSFIAEPALYATVSKKSGEVEALAALTYPNLGEVMKTQLALEEKIQSDAASFSPDERQALILERMLSYAGKVEQRFAATHLDKEICFAIIAAVLIMIFVPELISHFQSEDAPLTTPFFGVLGLILIGWQIAVSGRRFMNRQVLPHLAKALFPLTPSDVELEQAVTELRRRQLKIGKKLNLPDLRRHLGSPPHPPTPP
ncbi:MAG: hypothetical protein ABIT37_24130 [Luteolibacter sp.]